MPAFRRPTGPTATWEPQQATPVAFVLGTRVYHIAHQSFRLALSRMQAEAAEVGARGVVGVNFKIDNYIWGEHGTEFFATGTAIRKRPEAQRMPAPTFTLGLDT